MHQQEGSRPSATFLVEGLVARHGHVQAACALRSAHTYTFIHTRKTTPQPASGPSLDLAALFQETYARYTQRHTARGDRPCFFARLGERCYNTEEPEATPACLPLGVLQAGRVLGR